MHSHLYPRPPTGKGWGQSDQSSGQLIPFYCPGSAGPGNDGVLI